MISIKQSKHFGRINKLYKKYERFLVPGMLVLGVAVDFVTFRTIQIKTAFIVLAIYLAVASLAILIINIDNKKKNAENVLLGYLKLATPLVLQFTFGALLSASLIFYWFSGALSVSWPFMLIIALLMVSNETFRRYYLNPVVQIGVYYFVLFSYITLVLPFIFNSISVWIFLLGGLASLVIIYIFVELLAWKIELIALQKVLIAYLVVAILVVMNVLYFTNIIPPIPLSLREAGVYHNLERVGGDYVLTKEKETFIEKLTPWQTVHVVSGESIYLFSSVFAPSDLNTTIVHRWQFFDGKKRSWVNKKNFEYNIYGGRDGGYRGYSFSSNLSEGRWRVYVETKRGQVIGKIDFSVKNVYQQPELKRISR